jgi:hypothetical protein
MARSIDVRELYEFLARCNITGGGPEGYTRNFNLAAWDKGGRLYSIRQGSYRHRQSYRDPAIRQRRGSKSSA